MLGGTARRKKLLSPKGMDVRPMMEVVKGAAFDMLQVRLLSESLVAVQSLIKQFVTNLQHGSRSLLKFCIYNTILLLYISIPNNSGENNLVYNFRLLVAVL